MQVNSIRHDSIAALYEYSPHLLMYLEQYFTSHDLQKVNDVFAVSLLFGGLKELDFTRPVTEVKYNPRPARVALVIMREAGIRDLRIVCAGMSACVLNEPEANSELTHVLEPQELELARLSAELESMIKSSEFDSSNQIQFEAIIIGMSLFLDRVRHIHRKKTFNEAIDVSEHVRIINENVVSDSNVDLLKELVLIAQRFVKLGINVSPSLSVLIEHWIKRSMRSSSAVKFEGNPQNSSRR